MTVEGTVLRGPNFRAMEGRVVVEDGTIVAIEEAAVESEDIVLPAFVNAHTHLGDSIAKEAGRGLELEALVGPPDGLKHQLLAAASEAEQIEGMRRSLSFMQRSGTGVVMDFREEGIAGVKALHRATKGFELTVQAYGRGDPGVLSVAHGYGASGAHDGDYATAREAARETGKPFAIHAGEASPADVEDALALDPDYLVHMVHAEPSHLETVAEREIPIVVSPRSNLVTGVGLPPVERLREYTTVALGTDNVMLNSPSMFRELEILTKVLGVEAVDALSMATKAGAAVAGVDGGTIEPGEPARLTVLDGSSDNLAGYQDPVRAAVRRAGAGDVTAVHLPTND